MAKNKCTVLLGYEDDLITEKQKHFIDFTTNKVGGKAVRLIFCDYNFVRFFFTSVFVCTCVYVV